MTSTVVGAVKPSTRLPDIISATFPGASVTGAPKHHTMEIIAGLEKEPRGIYTGLIGLFLPGGDFVCSLPIRTVVHSDTGWTLGVGSGIVWDSDPEDEYQETLSKSAFISVGLEAGPSRRETPPTAVDGRAAPKCTTTEAWGGIFETMLLEADGKYLWSREHLDRMSSSAEALGLAFDRTCAEQLLAEFGANREMNETEGAEERPSEAMAIRLDLLPSGDFLIAGRPVPSVPLEPVTVLVSPIRIDPTEPLLRHKTASRPLYDQERAAASRRGFFEVIFLNRFGHITEGSITNIFARFGEVWVTPPVADGLLPGIWRAQFLTRTHAVEHSLTLNQWRALPHPGSDQNQHQGSQSEAVPSKRSERVRLYVAQQKPGGNEAADRSRRYSYDERRHGTGRETFAGGNLHAFVQRRPARDRDAEQK
jgi:para-aminobenzoate synthetase/4-amino-4-deoxychorismate lyase